MRRIVALAGPLDGVRPRGRDRGRIGGVATIPGTRRPLWGAGLASTNGSGVGSGILLAATRPTKQGEPTFNRKPNLIVGFALFWGGAVLGASQSSQEQVGKRAHPGFFEGYVHQSAVPPRAQEQRQSRAKVQPGIAPALGLCTAKGLSSRCIAGQVKPGLSVFRGDSFGVRWGKGDSSCSTWNIVQSGCDSCCRLRKWERVGLAPVPTAETTREGYQGVPAGWVRDPLAGGRLAKRLRPNYQSNHQFQ